MGRVDGEGRGDEKVKCGEIAYNTARGAVAMETQLFTIDFRSQPLPPLLSKAIHLVLYSTLLYCMC